MRFATARPFDRPPHIDARVTVLTDTTPPHYRRPTRHQSSVRAEDHPTFESGKFGRWPTHALLSSLISRSPFPSCEDYPSNIAQRQPGQRSSTRIIPVEWHLRPTARRRRPPLDVRPAPTLSLCVVSAPFPAVLVRRRHRPLFHVHFE
jgi:hypothetical protein